MSLISDRAVGLAASGQAAEAVRILSDASRAGDADADFQLGLWLYSGQYLVRKLAVARQAFARAAAAGHGQARSIYIAFVANGTGASPDWREAQRLLTYAASSDAVSAKQLALIQAMDLSDDGVPSNIPVSEQPCSIDTITLFRGLFSAAECDYLIERARLLLEPSVVIDPKSGAAVRDPIRTSDVAAFPLALEDPVIHQLNRRLAAATGSNVRQGEPLQVLRYLQGQEFKPHVDTLPFERNQRVATALVALNLGYEGGETAFLELDFEWKGNPGDALVFANVTADGKPDGRLRHAGRAVTAGEKMLASRWIRAHPLDLGDNS
jgi:prolyl 4-hydroxylase